jgi:hypothetical protein
MPEARFLANKNGVNQTLTDAVATKITFTNEVFDTGSYYNSATSVWTPPAGIILVGANAFINSPSILNNATGLVLLYKNGAEVARSLIASALNFCGPTSLGYVDQCTGADTYEVYGFLDTNASAPFADGSTQLTRFWGEWIATSGTISAAFRADKNGVSQSGIARNTWLTVTFPVERFDIGSKFAANTWTPPAGVVCMTASVGILGNQTAGFLGQMAVAKNGTRAGTALKFAVANDSTTNIVFLDQANGTDAYTVQGYNPATGGGRNFSGLANLTFFSGFSATP